MDSFFRSPSEKPIIVRMLRVFIFLFPFFAMADNSIHFDDFSCRPALSKRGKACKLFLCKGKNGYGIGRTTALKDNLKALTIFPVNTQSSIPYIEKYRLGTIKENGSVEGRAATSLLEVPPSILPGQTRDDFLTYKILSSKGYYLERDAHNQMHCDDPELKKLISDMDKVKDNLREKIKNHDYVKLVDTVGEMNIASRLAPRGSVPPGYCDIGNNTYATKETLKKLDDTEYKEPKGKVLSEKEAQTIFNELKELKDLPWDFTPEGCYARAQIAAEQLEKKGIAVGKAFYFGEDLWPSHLTKGPFDGWSFHVAPFVYVKGNDGKIRRMVLDPASQTKPIESYKFGQSLSREKNIQILNTRWTGGTDMTGLPAIQMIYTNLGVYRPDKIQPTDSKANHDDAELANKAYLKQLQERSQ